MESLLWILLALALVAAVGHGLWVLAAAMLRTLFGSPRPEEFKALQECPQCGERLRPRRRFCPSCGLDRETMRADRLADLQATARQLRRFLAGGAIDQATFDRLQAQVTAERLEAISRRRAPARRQVYRPEPREPARPPAEEIPSVVPAEGVPPDTAVPPPAPDGLPGYDRVLAPEPAAAAPAPVAAEAGPPAPPMPPPRPAPEEAAPVRPGPTRRRRSVGEVLAAFMEERNILWGELVGGLLIVGCSVALVISLWRTLETIPYFPFLVFALITACLFGAGLYTLHHWKLQSTSRGLLVIGALLVPLTFMVMADLSRGGGGLLPGVLVAGASLLVFGFLIQRAAAVLTPDGRWLLPFTIPGGCVSELLVPFSRSPAGWLAVGGLAVAAQAAGVTAHLLRRRAPSGAAADSAPPDTAQGRQTIILLGLATFAAAAALGFLLSQAAPFARARAPVAVLILLAATGPGLGLQRLDCRGDSSGSLPSGSFSPSPGAGLGCSRRSRRFCVWASYSR